MTESNFITYHSPDLGYTMKYPSNWELDESSLSNGIVRFKTGDATMPIFIISVDNVTQYLDTDTLTLKNTTLEQAAQERLHVYTILDVYYKLIRQNQVTVAGNAGLKAEYLLGNFYGYEVFTIIDGKLYNFTYKDRPGNVPETVKLANKVVESFKVTS